MCDGGCHEKLSRILDGTAMPGSGEYEENRDLIGRKQIITCLGPYCDDPCGFQRERFTPYGDSDGIGELIGLVKYLGDRVHGLLELIGKE